MTVWVACEPVKLALADNIGPDRPKEVSAHWSTADAFTVELIHDNGVIRLSLATACQCLIAGALTTLTDCVEVIQKVVASGVFPG